MYSRRSVIKALFGGTGLDLQQFKGNLPRCPVCRTTIQANHPSYNPAEYDTDGSLVVVAGVQDCFCSNCGARFVVKPLA